MVVGQLAGVGEQEVRSHEAARAGEPSATAGDLEHRGAVANVRVGARAESAPGAECERGVQAEAEDTRLDERAVGPDVDLPAAERLLDPGRRPRLGPEAAAVELDGLALEPECERDRLHLRPRYERAPPAAPVELRDFGYGDAVAREDSRELRAVRDVELAVRALEMPLDGARA